MPPSPTPTPPVPDGGGADASKRKRTADADADADDAERRSVKKPKADPTKPRSTSTSNPKRSRNRHALTAAHMWNFSVDAHMCLPEDTSATVVADITAAANAVVADGETSVRDAKEAAVRQLAARLSEKRQETIDGVERWCPDKAVEYAAYMRRDGASLPGRMDVVGALKGFSEVMTAAENKMTALQDALDRAIAATAAEDNTVN